ELVRFDDESAIRLWHFNFVAGPRSGIQAPLSRKRMSISRTVSDLTGKIQSTGVERQPAVEHLRCKERRPLVPPTTSIWRPEITRLQTVAIEAVIEGAIVGLYRSVAKPRAYLLRPVGSAAREKHVLNRDKFR